MIPLITRICNPDKEATLDLTIPLLSGLLPSSVYARILSSLASTLRRFGVAQGLNLMPLLLILYVASLQDVVVTHNLNLSATRMTPSNFGSWYKFYYLNLLDFFLNET